jgi:hypothetical protein
MSDAGLIQHLRHLAALESKRLTDAAPDKPIYKEMTFYWTAADRIEELAKHNEDFQRIARDLANPVDDTAALAPLVLYLANEEDRQEVIDLFREIKPNAEAIPV